jgi:hypothetical protein
MLSSTEMMRRNKEHTELITNLAVFVAIVLASGPSPKGFSHSGKIEISTQQIAQRVFPGVEPISPWQCPSTHIIKGNLTPSSGERCIFTFRVMRLPKDQTREMLCQPARRYRRWLPTV